ncbi:MAG: ATP-binding cassette domain-containing protein [Catenulispora sp.]
MIEAIELTSTRRSRGPGAGPVADVSFDVYPGQVTALLGAPGAGKSTVLRMMVELEPAGGGRTLFGGRPFHALRPAVREVGLALNPDALHPGRTVQAHLQLYSAAGGVPKGRIAEVLEIAGLSTQATARCGRLDPGRRQRLAIAAALLGDPAALILDEPHALDSRGMSWFHALIRAYAAQGRTVLVAATDPDSLAGTADHVVVLRRAAEDGISRVIASRSAAEVFDERRATVVQVRSPQAARLAAALETEGARLAPAGPGALQVRGLDRARIGEVAHVAGICLHELSETGHDDDVFGLRPLPRQKDLLPDLNHGGAQNAGGGATWSSGVRLVSTESPVREVDKGEVAEPATEAGAVVAETAMHAPVAEWRGRTGVPGQGGEADQGAKTTADSSPAVAAEAGQTLADQPQAAGAASRVDADRSRAVVAVSPVPADQPQVAAEAGQAHADQSRAAAVKSQTLAHEPPQPGIAAGQAHADQRQAAAEADESRAVRSRAASVASPAHAYQAYQPQVVAEAGCSQSDRSRATAEASRTSADPPQAASEPIRSQTHQPRAAAEAGRPPMPEPIASASPMQTTPPQPGASSEPSTPKRSANRAFATFRRRGKGEAPEPQPPVTIEAISSPPPAQPAVPFTVSPSPVGGRGADAEGMTPWRAVAARAAGRERQGSVVEAASAEQEASA